MYFTNTKQTTCPEPKIDIKGQNELRDYLLSRVSSLSYPKHKCNHQHNPFLDLLECSFLSSQSQRLIRLHTTVLHNLVETETRSSLVIANKQLIDGFLTRPQIQDVLSQIIFTKTQRYSHISSYTRLRYLHPQFKM